MSAVPPPPGHRLRHPRHPGSAPCGPRSEDRALCAAGADGGRVGRGPPRLGRPPRCDGPPVRVPRLPGRTHRRGPAPGSGSDLAHVYRSGPWIGGMRGTRPSIASSGSASAHHLAAPLTFLSLRHSWATAAESWGLNDAQIQRVLRHTSTRTQWACRHADSQTLREIAAAHHVLIALPRRRPMMPADAVPIPGFTDHRIDRRGVVWTHAVGGGRFSATWRPLATRRHGACVSVTMQYHGRCYTRASPAWSGSRSRRSLPAARCGSAPRRREKNTAAPSSQRPTSPSCAASAPPIPAGGRSRPSPPEAASVDRMSSTSLPAGPGGMLKPPAHQIPANAGSRTALPSPNPIRPTP